MRVQPFSGQTVSARSLTVAQTDQLMQLATQRRVFNRLDWWTVSEWLHSDALTCITSADRVTAGLLVVPVLFDDLNALSSSHSHCAWLRWCAAADGVSATRALKALFERGGAEWRSARITDTYCIVEPGHWFSHYLRDNGYRRVDEVITMICHESVAPVLHLHSVGDVKIRTATIDDLQAICDIDQKAFHEEWHYSLYVLERTIRTSAYCSVAIQDEKVVGYLTAMVTENTGHLSRLAVDPDFQGNHVGGTMLANALSIMQTKYAVEYVTLNTQASNTASQRLYARFGFIALHPRFRIVHKTHPG